MVIDGHDFRCPTCGKSVVIRNQPAFPFCSNRCRLIDLSNWIEEKYTSTRPLEPDKEKDDVGPPAGFSPQV